MVRYQWLLIASAVLSSCKTAVAARYSDHDSVVLAQKKWCAALTAMGTAPKLE